MVSPWGAYYVGSKIGESIKKERDRQKRYDELMEWEENYEKEKAAEKRRLEREAVNKRNELINSSTQLARKHYSQMREELKKAMNYDREGFVNAYVNWQLEVSTVTDREIYCAEALDEYREGLYDYAVELRNEDIRKAASIEYDNLRQSVKEEIPKELFLEQYVEALVPWGPEDIDTTGRYEYGLISEHSTRLAIEGAKEEISKNPYIDYGNDVETSENIKRNDVETSENSRMNDVEELEHWFALYEKGALTKEEYENKKAEILNNKTHSNHKDSENENLATEYNLKGIDYYNESNFSLAEHYFKKALELNNNDEVIWYNLGIVYKTQNNNDEATRCFLKAVELKQDYDDAQMELEELGVRYFL